MSYVVGVDGGGSQTTAVVADLDGRLIAKGHAGGSNHQGPGIDAALREVRLAVDAALEAAQAPASAVEFIQYGLAGADRPRDFNILRPALGTLPFAAWDVVSDAWQGLRAGTDDYIGVSLVCGSGTNAIGRNAGGLEVQVGGFGYAFGDAAGGRDLAVETFRAAVRAWQRRGPATTLTERVAAHLGLPDMEAVYDKFLDEDLSVPLNLAVVVHQAADAGDAAAQRILEQMGFELGLAANAVLDHLNVESQEALPVVLVGSVLQKGKSPFLLAALESTVKSRYPRAFLSQLDVPPVFGSVLLALDRLGRRAASDARETFKGWEES